MMQMPVSGLLSLLRGRTKGQVGWGGNRVPQGRLKSILGIPMPRYSAIEDFGPLCVPRNMPWVGFSRPLRDLFDGARQTQDYVLG